MNSEREALKILERIRGTLDERHKKTQEIFDRMIDNARKFRKELKK